MPARSHPDTEPEAYLIGHVHAALAEDSRVNQLDLRVTLAGGTLYVSGEVATPERQNAVGAVAREIAGDVPVCNEVLVRDLTPATPTTPEELS